MNRIQSCNAAASSPARPDAANTHASTTDPLAADRPALITGGAGFVGANVADRLLTQGRRVIILDTLARPGVEENLAWLRQTHGRRLEHLHVDVRDTDAVRHAVDRASLVFHFAAQVAVTTSLDDPIEDFTVNARGTLNILEAIRHATTPPPLLFTSTNKVYGDLDHIPLERAGDRYQPVDADVRRHGVSESSLKFCSPYGCSKGAADQYVLDYVRTYNLQAVVFRMSCIYGLHQFGTEDQGWVAHFLIRALRGETINIYGDGCQVRDVLFADDLVDAMIAAIKQLDRTAGHAFNIGGGADNAISLRTLLQQIQTLQGQTPAVDYGPWRVGDQRYYVSDTSAFQQATGWRLRVTAKRGIERLYRWLETREREHQQQRQHQHAATSAPAHTVDAAAPAGEHSHSA